VTLAPAPPARPSRTRARPAAAVALGLALVAVAVVVSRVAPIGLVLVGLALVALVGYASVAWPRATLVLVVLSPILDRYLVAGLLPRDLATATHFVSEGLLLVVSASLAVQAWRRGRLVAALRHPVTWLMFAFAAVGLVSAVLNGVPPQVAVIGLVFTVDAVVLFFLPRMIGFGPRQALLAIGAFVALMVVAALVALAQALLSPELLGLSAPTGRFGEVWRLASFIGDPNVFGAFLCAAVGFTLLAATHLAAPRHRWWAIGLAFGFLLALWLSFSRGSWLAMAVGVGVVIALLDRRTLLLTVVISVLSFATAVVMPRDLLVGDGEDGGRRPDLIDSTIDRVDTVGRGRDLRTQFVLNALPIVRDHPLVGVGPGRYGGAAADLFGTPVYDAYGTDELFVVDTQRTVDNFWLHLLVETGVLGAAAFLGAALVPGLAILRAALHASGARRILLGGVAAGTAALAVSAVSTMLLEANSVGFLFWFLLGLGGVVAVADTPGAG
jgi:O-antigen ligase